MRRELRKNKQIFQILGKISQKNARVFSGHFLVLLLGLASGLALIVSAAIVVVIHASRTDFVKQL